MTTTLPLLLCLFLSTVSARMHYNYNERVEFLESISDKDEVKRCNDKAQNGVEHNFVELPLDHGDESSPKYRNHYQVQRKFHDNTETVFLHVGGEGTSSPLFICLEDVHMMKLAKEHKALVVGSEHRYFGPNEGINDLANENLKYLTIEQALKDLAGLVKHINSEFKFSNPKWVIFGGSYPGTMTALFRSVYPELSVGGVASSAPLLPIVDFYQYAQVMEYAFNDTNPDCLEEIAAAYAALEEAPRAKEGLQDLISVFGLKKFSNPSSNDVYTLNLAIFDAFQGIVQYTYDGMNPVRGRGGARTVANVCNIFTKEKSKDRKKLLEKLFEVYKIPNTNKKGEMKPVDHVYVDYIARFQNDSYKGPERDYRGWMWLSCNEFGWLQTTTGSKTFGNTVPIHYYYQQCKDMFDLDLNTVDSQVKATLQRYGYQEKYNGTNVVLPNGLYDPWSAIGSYVNNPDTHTTVVTTEGAAHCHDMYPPYEGEPEGLNATRAVIADEVSYFLRDTAKPTEPPKGTTQEPKAGFMSYVSSLTVIALFALVK